MRLYKGDFDGWDFFVFKINPFSVQAVGKQLCLKDNDYYYIDINGNIIGLEIRNNPHIKCKRIYWL